MSAATSEAAGAMQHSYLTGLKGVQDYNQKWIEFAQANTQAAMDFYQKLSGVKSPSEFIELSTEHAQKAAYDADQAGQGTWGACPAGDAGGCGAT